MYKPHTYCRACNYAKPTGPGGIKSAPHTEQLVKAFSLGAQPLANDFKTRAEDHNGYAPLDVLYCPKCTLAQLSVVVDPVLLYQNYAYITSGSQTMQTHFERLWHTLCVDAGHEMKTVIEIGSNDGKLLKFLGDHGAKAVGIDPAENLVKIANDAGLQTVCGFFNEDTKNEALKIIGGPPECILARHVFCHIDDWQTTIKLIADMCGPKTVVAIEMPNAVDMLNGVQFDTVYHEHLSFMTTQAMQFLLMGVPLRLENVYQFAIHGGVMLMVLRPSPKRDFCYAAWQSPRLDDWVAFGQKAKLSITTLQDTVRVMVALNKRVVGFGASAKSTVWMNACKFTRSEIDFITDNTPFKQNKFSPGTDVPIVDEGALLRELPDYALMFSWNYKSEILQTQAQYISKGGRFIVPIPRIEIVP